MDDDQKLKIIFYGIITISAIVIVGVWEQIIQPVAMFLIGLVKNINISG